MKDTFDPQAFALASAREAFDQQHDSAYRGLGDAIMAYVVNVRDTLSEYDRMDALDHAVLTFCREVAVLGG